MIRYALLFCALFFFFPATTSTAQEQVQEKEIADTQPSAYFDLSDFTRLPILHNGRIKPLDSFARLFAKSFSGTETPQGKSALEWLAHSLFDPAGAQQVPLFKIRDYTALGLPQTPASTYSYAQLSHALQSKAPMINHLLQRPEKEWSTSQHSLMRAYQYSILYDQILRSLTMVLPLAITPPKAFKKKASHTKSYYNFMDLKKYSQPIKEKANDILRRKGDNIAKYTPSEKEIVNFSFQIQLLEQAGEQNRLLRFIPPQWKGTEKEKEWFSPWEIVLLGQGSPSTATTLTLWEQASHAYIKGDKTSWEKIIKSIWERTNASLKNKNLTLRFELEIIYNIIHPFKTAMLFYFLTLLALLSGVTTKKPLWTKFAYAALIPALSLHTLGIILRIFILERPPVGTLYESIIFVALICVSGAFFLKKIQTNKNKNKRKESNLNNTQITLLIASVSGTFLLFIAEAFATDDTMKMLMAVLNTNFWLTIHVLCITIGYGWCLLASFLAHLYLIGAAFPNKKNGTNRFSSLKPSIKLLAMIALLFTAVGTILGGLWADQSWGRFWGWDPKENGALAIILWLIWLLHGKLSQHISAYSWMAGIAALTIIVSLAWFGVNLLGVGLHSYGFISGILWGLGSFCLAEMVLILFLWQRTRINKM